MLGPEPHQFCLTFDTTDLADSVITSTHKQTISCKGHHSVVSPTGVSDAHAHTKLLTVHQQRAKLL